MADRLDLKDPIKRQPLTITVGPKGDLEVIGHQRKPRPAHLKALTASIERMGFITPLVAVERDGKYVIIDGQHRFQAGVELGMKEFPVVVVPEKLARRMMSLNIEQSLNIRERATIALSIYREMLEETPTRKEDDGEVVDIARDRTSRHARPRLRGKRTAGRQRLRADPEEVRRLPRQAAVGGHASCGRRAPRRCSRRPRP